MNEEEEWNYYWEILKNLNKNKTKKELEKVRITKRQFEIYIGMTHIMREQFLDLTKMIEHKKYIDNI